MIIFLRETVQKTYDTGWLTASQMVDNPLRYKYPQMQHRYHKPLMYQDTRRKHHIGNHCKSCWHKLALLQHKQRMDLQQKY